MSDSGMTDHGKHPVPHAGAPMESDPHARPSGHEREIDRDINLRGIAWTVFGLFVLIVVSMFAMWWMFEALLASEVANDPAPPPLLEARQQLAPSGPRLQAKPERDLQQFRARENAMKTSYAWQDEAAGVVRIPVGRAMEIVAEEGLTAGMSALAIRDADAADGLTAGSPSPDSANLDGRTPNGDAVSRPAAVSPAVANPAVANPDPDRAPSPLAVGPEPTEDDDSR